MNTKSNVHASFQAERDVLVTITDSYFELCGGLDNSSSKVAKYVTLVKRKRIIVIYLILCIGTECYVCM